MSQAAALYRCAVGTPNQMHDPTKPGGVQGQAKAFTSHHAAVQFALKTIDDWSLWAERSDKAGLANIESTLGQLRDVFALGNTHKVFDTQVDTLSGFTVRVELWRDDIPYVAPPKPTMGPKGRKIPKARKKKETT